MGGVGAGAEVRSKPAQQYSPETVSNTALSSTHSIFSSLADSPASSSVCDNNACK